MKCPWVWFAWLLLGCAAPPSAQTLARHVRPEYADDGRSLAERAAIFQQELEARHLGPDGLLVYRVQLEHPRERYDDLADAAAWTGTLLAAESLRWAATGVPAALERARQTVTALERLHEETGVRGLLARSYGRGDVSKDQYAGVIFGYAVAFSLCDDAQIRARIRAQAEAIADHLIAHHLRLTDARGQTTTHGDLRGRIAGLPIGVNALIALSALKLAAVASPQPGYERAYRRLVAKGYPELAYWAKFQLLGFTNPSNDNMAFLCFYALGLLERDPELLRAYRRALRRSWSYVKDEGNALFAYIRCALLGPDPRALAAARSALRAFPPTKRVYPVDLRGADDIPRACLPDREGRLRSRYPLPVNLRPVGSFAWKSSPYALYGNLGSHGEVQYAAVDYLLAYWLGRRHGGLTAKD